MKIVIAILTLILSSSAIADWKAVSGDEENLFWLLEKDSGKLMITRPDGLRPATTMECFSDLAQPGNNRYDIIKAKGRLSPVLVLDTVAARYVTCRIQGRMECYCGIMTTFSDGVQSPASVPSAPMNLR